MNIQEVSIEWKTSSSRPAIANKRDNMIEYDTVFVGFPIWWYVAPTIINTFLESYDMTGKTIIPFATSGGSGWEKRIINLPQAVPVQHSLREKVFRGNVNLTELDKWYKSLQ